MHVHAVSTGKMQRVLRFSLIATLAYVLLTLVAGLRAHSLALISEAGHNASDALALLLSFVAVHFQARPATDKKTFGYQRAGVLAAYRFHPRDNSSWWPSDAGDIACSTPLPMLAPSAICSWHPRQVPVPPTIRPHARKPAGISQIPTHRC